MHNQDQAAILAIEGVVGTTAGTGVLTNFSLGDMAARKGTETHFSYSLSTILNYAKYTLKSALIL